MCMCIYVYTCTYVYSPNWCGELFELLLLLEHLAGALPRLDLFLRRALGCTVGFGTLSKEPSGGYRKRWEALGSL